MIKESYYYYYYYYYYYDELVPARATTVLITTTTAEIWLRMDSSSRYVISCVSPSAVRPSPITLFTLGQFSQLETDVAACRLSQRRLLSGRVGETLIASWVALF